MQTCSGFFLKSLLESPGNFSVKFVDTLTPFSVTMLQGDRSAVPKRQTGANNRHRGVDVLVWCWLTGWQTLWSRLMHIHIVETRELHGDNFCPLPTPFPWLLCPSAPRSRYTCKESQTLSQVYFKSPLQIQTHKTHRQTQYETHHQ